MKRRPTDFDIDQAQAMIELIRGLTSEARCRALLERAESVEAHLEFIVLEQTLNALSQARLPEAEAITLSELRVRVTELAPSFAPRIQQAGSL